MTEPLTVDIACAALVRDGRILLGFRSRHRRWFPSVWDLFGGHVESNESVEAALVRELREELGVTATNFERLVTLPLRETEAGGPVRRLHVFQVLAWAGGEPCLVGDEHEQMRWCTLAEALALDLAVEDYRDLLRRVLD